ncbi:MAG: MerR family DNA-binding transcriptional regulator [Rhizobiales bacterium]|nr:MerR family DNA-binding transcriptional regulator [Hyphomicrobiales bacterium]
MTTKMTIEPEQQFSITELSAMFNLTPRALRFYETKQLISPQRIGSRRVYSKRDKGRLALVVLGKNVGFSLDEIKEMLDLYDLRDGQKTQLKLTSKKFRAQIQKLVEQKKQIQNAIEQLSHLCDQVENAIDGRDGPVKLTETTSAR